MTKKLIQDIIFSSKKSPKQPVRPPRDEEKLNKEDVFYDFSKEEIKNEKAGTGVFNNEKPKTKLQPEHFRFKFPRFFFGAPTIIKSVFRYKLMGVFFATVVLIIAGTGLLNKFSSIIVEIIPRVEMVEAVDAVFSAKLEPKNGELLLEIMILNRRETGSSPATGVKDIKSQASGEIIIYNVYSSQPQSLVAGTRFQASDRKIYRINQPIVIAGAKIVNGKIIASETEAIVFSDKPGEEYNIGLADFIIPGFQDKEKRDKIYARSKTEMTGGFVGQKKVVTEEDIVLLKKSLREKITDYFLKAAFNPKPDEFLLYDAAEKIVFNEQKNSPKAGDVSDILELEENGTFYGFLVKKEDLGRLLAKKYFPPENYEQLEILNPENLEFELKNYDATQATLGIKGKANFIWKLDKNNLKNELIAERKNPESVFRQYKFIEKAKIIFKPSWWRRIPMDSSRIEIKTIINQ